MIRGMQRKKKRVNKVEGRMARKVLRKVIGMTRAGGIITRGLVRKKKGVKNAEGRGIR